MIADHLTGDNTFFAHCTGKQLQRPLRGLGIRFSPALYEFRRRVVAWGESLSPIGKRSHCASTEELDPGAPQGLKAPEWLYRETHSRCDHCGSALSTGG
jgi:hypothetical protein